MADLVNNSAEAFVVVEGVSKRPSQAFVEALAVRSFYPATPYYAGADLGIYSEAFDATAVAEFIRSRSPLGYSPFRDFVAGEYKFQKAYLNFVFTPLDGADAQLLMLAATVTADVPDRTETNTGVVTSAASGLTVAFSQAFAAPPKVVVTPISSTTPVVPVLTGAPTTAGFTVKLFDLSGAAATGSFIWTAIGY